MSGCKLTAVLLVFTLQVSKKNLMEIVKKLMLHVDKAEGTTYRDELLTKIIDICSQSNYQYITNFEWWASPPPIAAPPPPPRLSGVDVHLPYICLAGTSASWWS